MQSNDLLELADPFSRINKRFREMGRLGHHAKEAHPIQPLEPEEEESILSKAVGAPLSALGYIGGALDKPRRALWGAIGGRPREALNLIPFSDAMGLTNEHDAIGGREALEKIGVLGPNQEGLDAGDVAGFAAEVLGDPLTYLGGLGALGKAGKTIKKAGLSGDVLTVAAKKTGRPVASFATLSKAAQKAAKPTIGKLEAGQLTNMSDILAHVANDPKKLKALEDAAGGAQQLAELAKSAEPVSGLTTFGMPLMGPGKVIGTGERAQRVARKLDDMSRAVRYSTPVRFGAKVFSKPVKQTAEAQSQIRAAEGFTKGQAGAAEIQTDMAIKWQKLLSEGKVHPDDWPDYSRIMGEALEQTTARDPMHKARPLINQAARFVASNPTPPARIQGEFDKLLKETGFSKPNLPGGTPADHAALGHAHLKEWLAKMPQAPARESVEDIVNRGLAGSLTSGKTATQEAKDLVIQIAKEGRQQADTLNREFTSLGGGSWLNDAHSLYAPRTAAYATHTLGTGGKSYPTRNAHQLERKFKDIPRTDYGPGGRGTVDTLVRDPDLAGKSARLPISDAIKKVREEVLGITPADTAEFQKLGKDFKAKAFAKGSPEEWRLRSLEAAHKQADFIADFLRNKVPDERVAKNLPQYRDMMADQMGGMVRQRQSLEAAKAAHDLTADVASRTIEGKPVSRALGSAGLKGTEALRAFAERLVERGKLSPKVLAALDSGSAKMRGRANKLLKSFNVPDAHAKDIERVMNFYKDAEPIAGLLHNYDRLTNLLKSHLTVISPGFWARNLQTMLWSDGLSNIQNPLNPKEWSNLFSNWKMQYNLLKGRTVKGLSEFPAFKGMSDEEATQVLRAAQYGHRVASAKVGVVSDILGAQGQDLSHFSRDIPGVTPTSPLLEIQRTGHDIKQHGKQAANPFATRGTYNPFANGIDPRKGAEVSREGFSPWFLANAGERANSYTETLGRGATMIGQLRNGASMEVAGNVSRAAHVDYGSLTSVEKAFMQRIFPFYAWAKGSIPFTLQQLWERPGGPTAKAIKATNAATESDPFVPEQLRGSASMPIGEGRSPGTKRYLTMDLPHETLNDWFSKRPTALGTIKASGAGILSQLNPLLKGTLELVTGQSFFQRGRDLRDLYSPTGQGPIADQLLTNSPASRYLSTFSQLAQPSDRKTLADKAVNIFSGLRLQDVDMNKAKQAAVREYASELLRGSEGVKAYTDVYMPRDAMENMTPQQRDMLRLLKTQGKRANDRKKEATAEERAAAKRRKKLLAGLAG